MDLIKKYKSQFIFHLIVNSFIGVLITFSSYYHLPLNNTADLFFYGAHFLTAQFTVFGLVYLLSLNKYIFNTIFPFFFISHALIAFWVYTLDISITDSIIHASLETKATIVFDLISFPIVLYFLVSLFVVLLILKLYAQLKVNAFKSPLMLVAVLAILGFIVIEKYRCCTLKRRLPYSPSIGLINYLKKNEPKLTPVPNTVYSKNKKISIVFILGESVRADHLHINGYERNTTPNLSKNNRVISYPNVYTPLTYTAISVPQILTNTSVYETNKQEVYSLYTILNKVNYETIWIGNQTPEKSYNIFIEQNRKVHMIDLFHSVLSFKKKLDDQLLIPFDSLINQKNNQFITLHMIGSHWWYENKYSDSFRKFKPVLKSKYLPSTTKEEVINSYDNTILFMDSFIDNVIKRIEKDQSNTLLVYVSDHGENLGEKGKWLHGQGNKASTNPAVLFWYSKAFERNHPKQVEMLYKNANKNITLDFFYHSMLDLLQIEGIDTIPTESVFK